MRFAFRGFPLTEIHRHALAASLSAEAAALQDSFWAMHELPSTASVLWQRAICGATQLSSGSGSSRWRVAKPRPRV
jgi:hypothetical protein